MLLQIYVITDIWYYLYRLLALYVIIDYCLTYFSLSRYSFKLFVNDDHFVVVLAVIPVYGSL